MWEHKIWDASKEAKILHLEQLISAGDVRLMCMAIVRIKVNILIFSGIIIQIY